MKLTQLGPCGLVLLLVLVLPVGVSADDETEAAERAAVVWLSLVDAGLYELSWKEAATLFRKSVSASDWVKAASAAREPLGNLVDRNLVTATYSTTLPGAPDGEYVVLQFRTVFENKAQAIETVTPMLDDGRWRVSGYYVR
ncbi:MAG: DUF4019 domain-containing protein [Gammaproteobacteria bacterium]|jgi:hypothetical protein